MDNKFSFYNITSMIFLFVALIFLLKAQFGGENEIVMHLYSLESLVFALLARINFYHKEGEK